NVAHRSSGRRVADRGTRVARATHFQNTLSPQFHARPDPTRGVRIPEPMILRELMATKASDTARFFGLQAEESIRWLSEKKVIASSHPKALDLGCGFGFFGHALSKAGFATTFSDEVNFIHDSIPRPYQFIQFDVCKDDFSRLGTYDLVVFSNVLEHLPNPEKILRSIPELLNENGVFYLCWTNWLGPYGGHEYTPYHYLGPKLASWLFQVL